MAKKPTAAEDHEPEGDDLPRSRMVRVTFAGYADWAGSAASLAVGVGQRWQPETGEYGLTFRDGPKAFFVPWPQIKFIELVEVKA